MPVASFYTFNSKWNKKFIFYLEARVQGRREHEHFLQNQSAEAKISYTEDIIVYGIDNIIGTSNI